jgi:ribosomal protein S18 acetylase RimI-like enzyme
MAHARAVRLEEVPPADLRALLEQERTCWVERLSWDPGNAAEVTAQAVDCGLLAGAALVVDGRAIAHLALQPSPAVVRLCSAHVPPGCPSAQVEMLVDSAVSTVRSDVRIEGQLAVFEAQAALDDAFARRGFVVEERRYLQASVHDDHRDSPERDLRPFDRRDLGDCARVLVDAHDGGVEATINEAFRGTSSALTYLVEVAGGPSCPALLRDASWVAIDSGRLVGFCLATEISAGVGHVPQIAVVPDRQGRGIGDRLLDRSLGGMARSGLSRVTLSVSVANVRAREWYRRHGFDLVTRFSSYHRDPLG